MDSARRSPTQRQATIFAVCRFGLTFLAVIGAYYLIPFHVRLVGVDLVLRLLLALGVLVVLVVWQLRQISRARFPTLRAMEALGAVLPFFLCTYAGSYLVLSASAPGTFNETLSHTSALYFTVVVFGTVGFGDITPLTDVSRLLVGSQVLANLVFIALVVRALFEFSRRTVAARKDTAAAD